MSIQDLDARVFARQHQYCPLFMTLGKGRHKWELLQPGTALHVCLPSVCLMSLPDLPGYLSPYLHTAKSLEVEMA